MTAARIPVSLVCLVICLAASLGHAGAAGANLLRNPGAEAGAPSAQGWDNVTIPGWAVAAGLPTVVRYGTAGFPAEGHSDGAPDRGQMFAGGAGGSARLVQWVTVRAPGGVPAAAGTPYVLSARLGSSVTSRASVRIAWFGAGNRRLAASGSAPVRSRTRGRATRLVHRAIHGRVPSGATRAEVTIRLNTSLTNIDGPDAPLTGYDRAVADDVSLDVGASVVSPAPLTAPASRVPRYDHVFLFYFENQDVHAIVGNHRQAPYYNSLIAQGSELGAMYAEEHPSDGNYLALAGGSVFGIPLTDPAEVNSQYTIRAANLGGRVDAAGETWKTYEQSSAGPCDDTVHGNYWDDDLPMMYFADVRDRPAYCSAHVVPLETMATDLAQTSTTPNFTWVGINDCDDMEGCGVRAGDRFLADELGQIMRSPAWRTQRSLAIITFDEDNYDHERPAQRVPTVALGSAGVRHGYVSPVRYTHYSVLRTVEAALGLGTLTRNDRYAQPINDIFQAGAPAARPPTSPYQGPQPAAAPRRAATVSTPVTPAPPPGPSTAFVVSSAAGTVTPITLAARLAGRAIHVGRDPGAIALTPDNRMAYVVNSGSDTVTPIQTGTRRALAVIPVGQDPQAIAVTPDGTTAFVSDAGSDTVTPIDLRTDVAGTPIPVGADPRQLAITPDGRTVYVCDWQGSAVTPIDVGSRTARSPVPVGSYPSSIVIARHGGRAYVANYGSDTITPIVTADDRAGRPIAAGQAPDAIALTPDGATLEVVDGDTDRLTAIATAEGRAGRPVRVGISPTAVAVPRSGRTAFVVNTISGTVTPVTVADGHRARAISVGAYAYPTQIAIAPDDRTAVVLGTYSGRVALVNTRTGENLSSVKVGALPVAVAIAR